MRIDLPQQRPYLKFDKSCKERETSLLSVFSKAFELADRITSAAKPWFEADKLTETSREFAKSRSDPASDMYDAMFNEHSTKENDKSGQTALQTILYEHIMEDPISTYQKPGDEPSSYMKSWNAFMIEIFYKTAWYATPKVPLETVAFCDTTRFRKQHVRENGKLVYWITDRTFPKIDQKSKTPFKFKEVSKDKSKEDSVCAADTFAFVYQAPASSNFKRQVRLQFCPHFFETLQYLDRRSIVDINSKGLASGPLKNSMDGILPDEVIVLHEIIHAVTMYFKDQIKFGPGKDGAPIIRDYAYRYPDCKELQEENGIATFLNANNYEHVAKGIGLSNLQSAAGGRPLSRMFRDPINWEDGIIDPMTGEQYNDPDAEWRKGEKEFKRVYGKVGFLAADKKRSMPIMEREVASISASGNHCDSSVRCTELLCASIDFETCASAFYAPCPCVWELSDSGPMDLPRASSLPAGADQALSSAYHSVFPPSPSSSRHHKCGGRPSAGASSSTSSFLISSLKETSFSTSDFPETVTIAGSGSGAVVVTGSPSTTTVTTTTIPAPVTTSASSNRACDDE
ncbi:MAG: hypothetical protein Q9227_002275 [Pyrenula ochraceoflavens]